LQTCKTKDEVANIQDTTKVQFDHLLFTFGVAEIYTKEKCQIYESLKITKKNLEIKRLYCV